jgi:hypothetical protein
MQRPNNTSRLKRVVTTHLIASYTFAAVGIACLHVLRPDGFSAKLDYEAAVIFLAAPLLVPVFALYALTALTVSTIPAVVYVVVYASLWWSVFIAVPRFRRRGQNI